MDGCAGAGADDLVVTALTCLLLDACMVGGVRSRNKTLLKITIWNQGKISLLSPGGNKLMQACYSVAIPLAVSYLHVVTKITN